MTQRNGSNRSLALETIAAQGGSTHDGHFDIVPAIPIATTYLRDPDNQYRSGYSYGRDDNPLVRQAEGVLRELECAGGPALLFSSGMSAAITLFLSLPRPARIIAPGIMYWALRQWLVVDGPGHGLSAQFVDLADPDALSVALAGGPTALVWIETPGNPMWNVTDIAAVAGAAHAAGAIVACDSTVATPILTRPLEHGADVVMHSASKYLNGHTDVIAGALVFAEENVLAAEAARARRAMGPILGPFEASLLLRGMRTLPLRVRHQSRSALDLAIRLRDHPHLAEVLYPGLPGSAGHKVAAGQMDGGFGGMLSIRVAGGERAAIACAANVGLWTRATSLGGVESLIEHRASIEGPGTPVPPDLLRLSVGLEAVDDLFADLDQALAAGAA